MPLTGIGVGEMIVIGMLVLIVFGPRRLPEVTRTLGKAVREFKKGMNEIQRELDLADRDNRWNDPKPVSRGPARPASPATPTTPPPAGEAEAPGGGPAATPGSGPAEPSIGRPEPEGDTSAGGDPSIGRPPAGQPSEPAGGPASPASPEPTIGPPEPAPTPSTTADELPTDDPGPYGVEPPNSR